MNRVHSSAEGGASIPGELVERLEVAERGNREMDLALAIKLERKLWLRARTPSTVERNGRQVVIPRYTTSLDAALALAERVLPQANCMGFDRDPKGADAYVSRNCVPREKVWLVEARAATPALALCAAILKATTAPETGAVGTTEGREPKSPTTREGADR